ncbi:MAG: hypothetical protein ACR2OJ_06935 [Hyphomicrobiales bacterium]
MSEKATSSAQMRRRVANIENRIKRLELTCFRRVRNAYGCVHYGLDGVDHSVTVSDTTQVQS